jgi:bacterioferritin (cytochrome b1)
MPTHTFLVEQLNALLRLTQTEKQIAETRRLQASTEQVERELRQNAESCDDRARLLTEAVRNLDSLPDVVGVAVGRMAATLKASAEQGQDLVEALLGDLGLEHELLDRTRLARMVAEQLGETKTVKVLDRLEKAHTEMLDWLMTRLAEVAVGGPAALRPTPAQSVAGFSRRVTQFPARRAAATVNRTVALATDIQQRTADTVATNVDRTRQLVDAANEIWTAGRDATLKRSEEVAREQGARDTARTLNRTRRELGAVDAVELPIRSYDSLAADAAISRINRLRDVDDVRTVLAYEAANKQRKGVTAAAQARVEQLAAQLASVS